MNPMLLQQLYSTQSGTAPPPIRDVMDWQNAAVAAYRQAEREELVAMRAKLASRIRELTGLCVAPATIAVDRDKGTAIVAVDSVSFRLRRSDLVLIRPHASRTGYIESAPIENISDLGRALVALENQDDLEMDGEDWTHSF